ncbi:MAG TPA: Mut7-C RNAse domain-containing protein [Dehalococcoidia bacterium]|nr:Mut7-C RNAse domain-containing protein [Dehalococcoidia bacterium]
MKFLVDMNVGKLARLLRMMGYDALLFQGHDDGALVKRALAEGRVVLTKDGQVFQRRVVRLGRLKALRIEGEDPFLQLRQVVEAFRLKYDYRPFSLCLECNVPLEPRAKEEVRGLVPPFVYESQEEFHQCPACKRLYWRGTHWQHMGRVLRGLEGKPQSSELEGQ